jgi:hypothetical protein
MAIPVLKRIRGNLVQWILFALLFSPLWMYIAWHLTEKRKLVVAIIDKTVLTQAGQEHISLNWVLNHERFSKTSRDLYEAGHDYFGFFPYDNQQYRVKGLERFSSDQLDRLSRDADAAYITDTYGIYSNEWFEKGDSKERSGIVYGGMSRQDFSLLKKMTEQHKLIVAEFNCLGSPTDSTLRHDFENHFGVRWSGWIGRYFDSFDTVTNKEIPHWLIKRYLQQHNNKWPFTKSGIAFVRSDDKVVILENQTHLDTELPYIYTGAEGQSHYGMPEKIKYAFWFDILTADTSYNHIISRFRIDANLNGQEELAAAGIPSEFPAITAHNGRDYRFFYFSGDFCDNPIGLTASRFKGIEYLRWFMYNRSDLQERKSFFWTFYRPLVTTILNDYYAELPKDVRR